MKSTRKILSLFKNKQFLYFFAALILLVLVTGGILFYFRRTQRIFIDDSLISAPVINIASETPGILSEMEVSEGQTVQKGDQLALVDGKAIRAQTNGLIIQTDKQIGSVVGPTTSVASMIHPADFRVIGTLDENKGLDQVRVGQVASFTVDAYPGQVFWGWVDEVAPSANQTSLSFSISDQRPTQQFDIYVKFDTSKYPSLKNGMSAKITVYTNTN